jgi:hypothetical protein
METKIDVMPAETFESFMRESGAGRTR